MYFLFKKFFHEKKIIIKIILFISLGQINLVNMNMEEFIIEEKR